MDTNITYDVRFWKTDVYKGKKVTTYTVRWKTGDAPPWKEPFRNRAQADSFLSSSRPPPARAKHSASTPAARFRGDGRKTI